ncbi:MAG: class I adenylate-forming enzyme family protein [Actinomycetota bacterium]|nr:long-chain fatty acid--CoA ligase [Actinomycetota bacterium]
MATDELVVVDLPPGPEWVGLVTRLWLDEVPFLPLDHRLADRERRAIVDRARPHFVRDTRGETLLADAAPVTPGVAVVMPTAGTAGEPKLVELHRVAVVVAVSRSDKTLGASPEASWLCPLTPAHIGGLLVVLRAAILGASVTIHERFDPARLVSDGEGAAFASVVPGMVRRLVASDLGLHGLTLLVGGDDLDAETAGAARARGARLVTTYGLTETCGGFAYDGVPLDGMQVRLDTDDSIEVSGSTVMENYRLDPAATGAAFTTDGWLRTGDLGSIDDGGRLAIHGRADHVIRTGAEKVWPEEVERVLARHPKVADVAVIGRPDPEWGSRVSAFVVPRAIDDPPSLDELRVLGAEHLARFKLPRELSLVPGIPRTRTGKVRRHILR